MAGKNSNKKASSKGNKAPGKTRKRNSTIEQDSFFEGSSHKRSRRFGGGDEYITSSDEDDSAENGRDEAEDEIEELEETPAEKKKRLADAFLVSLREKERRREEEEERDLAEDDDERREEKEGKRDSLILKTLQQEQLEESGRVRRAIASRVQKPETSEGSRLLVKHGQPVTCVALSDDDSVGYSGSKDGTILRWDVNSGKTEKYHWPSEEVLKSHGLRTGQGYATKPNKNVLSLAVSSDGRYLATGGLDRHVHLWDVRTRQHVQAFPGHKGPVSCLTFRQGTSELFSGSFDRSIKIWNAEDRTYINTLFGHQSEVLTIDSLRKERVLTVGRDRTMHLWKVPEESQLIFRAPASSLECCCFINNDEFLSGSDDGSIEQWSVARKKPIRIVRNAHANFSQHKMSSNYDHPVVNGNIGNDDPQSESKSSSASAALFWISSVAVCRSSDLAASGAGNGSICLWAIEEQSKAIRPLFELPQAGFVTSLAFAKSGKFLIAGVGKEPRLGRWGRIPDAKNGVSLHTLELS